VVADAQLPFLYVTANASGLSAVLVKAVPPATQLVAALQLMAVRDASVAVTGLAILTVCHVVVGANEMRGVVPAVALPAVTGVVHPITHRASPPMNTVAWTARCCVRI
jgi:hypothetical protein